MAKKPLTVPQALDRDGEAKFIANTWFLYNSNRREKIEQWKELRNYVFATDTRTTTNKKLPWKNSTTLPKLCQLRDNLHSNYFSALFPNDNWVKWDAYSKEDALKDKAKAIESYIANKARQSHFRTEASKLLYDFIDYGNAFATVDYLNSFTEDLAGQKVVDYTGPIHRRISPLDIVFNPLAASFKDSFKIVRSMTTIGEMVVRSQEHPEDSYLKSALERRKQLFSHARSYGLDDFDKAEGMLIDGFGNYFEYLQSGNVELLTFYGDLYNEETGVLEKNMRIVVMDRCWIISKEPIPNWLGHAPIYHVGWRTRPDNLWAMGPLDNLVGMQYRIDHMENLKADALDLAVMPPLVIKGDVEEFTYAPGSEIHIDENGSVEELARNVQWVIQCDNEISMLEERMEMYAGAPREAMGMRTPGEKTAFEVQQLQNAAGRIFQEKITTFEIELLEPVLNAMLEVARRNMDSKDVIQVMDDDLGVRQFVSITREDITAVGKIRPIGARHYAAQAQLVQNITGIFNGAVGQMIAPHTSAKELAFMIEEILQLEKYKLFRPNVAVTEQQETQSAMNQAQEDLVAEQSVAPPLV